MQRSTRGSSGTMERRALTEQPLFFDGDVRARDKNSGRVTLKNAAMQILDVVAVNTMYVVKDSSKVEHLLTRDKANVGTSAKALRVSAIVIGIASISVCRRRCNRAVMLASYAILYRLRCRRASNLKGD